MPGVLPVMPITIRPLVEADLPAVDRILQAAFERAQSFEAMLRLNGAAQPGNQLVAVENGTVVGTVGAVDFGQLAYVALMGVDPACHGRGIARRLMESVLARLDAAGCPTVLLDATDAGAALYEKLGFVDDSHAFEYEQPATPPRAFESTAFISPTSSGPGQGSQLAWARQGHLAMRPMTGADLGDVAAFDAPLFGSNRGRLLQILLDQTPNRAIVARDTAGHVVGYAFSRGVIGPWVARDAETAEMLFCAATGMALSDPVRVLVPRSNGHARELLDRLGLKQIRQLRHMRRGGSGPPGKAYCLFGQVSFGLG
jgi:predicted N-acetyltransferase YhbS